MTNKEKIIDFIVNKKKPVKEVAKTLKITENQLRFLLDKWEVQIPKRAYKRVPMPDRETLMRLFTQSGSTSGVAKVMGIGINTVSKWMKELKIPMKKLSGMSEKEKMELLEYHIDTIKI